MMQEADQDDEQILFDQEGLLSNHGSSSVSSSSLIKRQTWTRKFIKTIVLCIAFFALGLCIAIPGPTLLDLGQRVHVTTEKISLIFTARSLGYLLGSIIGGFLFDRFDQILLLFYTLMFTAVATAVAPWCTVLIVLAVMIAFQGISMGVLDTGGNVFCIKIWGKKSAPYMQLLHFAFGVGAFIAPLLARPFLVNHELLAASNHTSLMTRSPHPYLGRAPVLVNLQDISKAFADEEHHRNARDMVNITDNFLVNTTVITDQNFTSTTFEPTTQPLPKKPSKTLGSGGDNDASKASKILKEQETKKDKKHEEEEEKKDPTTVSPTSSTNIINVTSSSDVSNSTVTIPTTQSAENGSQSTNSVAESSPHLATTTTEITTTPVPTTTTLAPTTKGTTTTQPLPTTTQPPTTTTTPPQAPIDTNPENPHKDQIVTTTELFSSILNNSMNSSDVTIHKKPDTASGDIINSAIDALSNMSKIQFAYLIIGLLLAVNAFMFLLLYCKEKHRDLPSPQEEQENHLRRGTRSFRIVILSLLFIFYFIYVGMEVTYGGFLSTFSVQNMNWTEQQGATVTAVFWGSIAAGRGIAIFVAKVCSPACMLIADLILLVLGAVILCFGIKTYDILLWVGTLTLGLGMSSLFPTGISWADHYFPLTGKATGILVVGSALGEMVVPFVTGYMLEHQSYMALMYVMLVLSVVAVVIYAIMQVVASNKKSVLLSPSRNGFEVLKDDDDMLPLDLLEPQYTNGLTDSTRNRQPIVSFKPQNNGEYKRLIDISDQEFS